MAEGTTGADAEVVFEIDQDEEMADLFSFGVDASTAAPPDPSSSPAVPTPNASPAAGGGLQRSGSDDSLLEMLDNENKSSVFVDATPAGHNVDDETREILDWLADDVDQGGDNEEEITFSEDGAEVEGTTPIVSTSANSQEKPTNGKPPLQPTPPIAPTVVSLPPTFDSLKEALESKKSTPSQIRDLYAKEGAVNPSLRAELYCRMICSKTLEDTKESSLADSFEQWKPSDEKDEVQTWLEGQAKVLAERFGSEKGLTVSSLQSDLVKLLLYHQKSAAASGAVDKDPLIPPVAATLLATGMPVGAASVALAQIVPNFMPVLALKPNERWEGSLSLHTEFYLLACYHVPLLVFHLDRYLPGWYWPKLPDSARDLSATEMGRNLQKQGALPPSWLLSHFSGESEGTQLPVDSVLALWDGMLTTVKSNDMRFFLALAVLEDASDSLLLATGDDLLVELNKVFGLEGKGSDWPKQWYKSAYEFQLATPESVLTKLKSTEDTAVQETLKLRHERAEAALKARLEAEANAHKEAQERKSEEARERLTRARLVAFYRKHASDKEDNIDAILEKYKNSLDVLDTRLKAKYGEGFNPAIKPKPKVTPVTKKPGNTNKLLATMNQGFGRKRVNDSSDEGPVEEEVDQGCGPKVSVTSTAAEVLPAICWSKEASATRSDRRSRQTRKLLKFYLVDSRSEEAAQEQGRFPTAASLSPEALLDPERVQQNEEMFESLRGAVHIVIMGEGFSALPSLYEQKLNPKMEDLMMEDESRTNGCALFFIKKGFPFVSILDGGFAAAHSWLVREGPKKHLEASSVLVDYDPEVSIFCQMESHYNRSTAEKAHFAMQNLLESSLVSMTRRAQQLEKLASELEGKEQQGKPGIRLNFFGGGAKATTAQDAKETEEETKTETTNGPVFRNPFARKPVDSVPTKENGTSSDKENGTANGTHASPEATEAATTEPTSPSSAEASPTQEAPGTEVTPAAAVPADKTKPNMNPLNNNPFKGLGAAINKTGAALNKSIKNNTGNNAKPDGPQQPGGGMPNMLKRNPFAGFNKPKPETAKPTGKPAGNGFGGFNRFRMPGMPGGGARKADDEPMEEAISFDSDDSVKAEVKPV